MCVMVLGAYLCRPPQNIIVNHENLRFEEEPDGYWFSFN